MKTLTEYQTIKGKDGVPLFVIVPYVDFMRDIASRSDSEADALPHEVVGKIIIDKLSPIRAWREYLGLTQADVAVRMGITQSAFAQFESSRPRKTTLAKIAAAMGLTLEQMDV